MSNKEDTVNFFEYVGSCVCAFGAIGLVIAIIVSFCAFWHIYNVVDRLEQAAINNSNNLDRIQKSLFYIETNYCREKRVNNENRT